MYRALIIVLLLLMQGCASTPPSNMGNACDIFEEKSGWYKDAAKASKQWGVPISDMLAFVYQESRFVADARPPRTKILWIIPGPRKSSAYGYPQAKSDTWSDYQRAAGHYGADRDDFGDAMDFMGWYNNTSYKRCNIKYGDTYHSYLAYHEGQGGFNRRTYKKKKWLLQVAKKVSKRSKMYASQLNQCEASLKRSGWFNWF